jgi:ADP-heptose:LPS heptosyltransferase
MPSKPPASILIIQTAFIGDVILATPVIEKLHSYFPNSSIDFLLRKGNESLLHHHPIIREVLIWDKKTNKIRNLFKLISKIRNKKYDCVINLHRFASSGILTVLSNAKQTIGFDKNPFSFLFSIAAKHQINNGKHEVIRNLELIYSLTDDQYFPPKLYPSPTDFKNTEPYKVKSFVCLAPTSVWYTKQFPQDQWEALIKKISNTYTIYLLGAPSDFMLCENIKNNVSSPDVHNLCGKLSFLESAALMRDATMNYVNDSAPLHLCSAMNAKVTAVFCSTIPGFGFGPLSDTQYIVETKVPLNCRPCGLHGHKACPEGHFKCARTIELNDLLIPVQANV